MKELILNCNLDYALSYSSSYLRKLIGQTNAHTERQVDITVYINDVETSPVNILNSNDELTKFEKDLYLNDGYNVIKVIAKDISNNESKQEIFEVTIDCMPSLPEKVDLITNFIGDDDLNISLHVGNADLKYVDNSVGLNKTILLNTSIDSHYFTLSGENANLYRLSKDDIPKIQSDIIKRPLNVVYDYVEKIYDGNADFTNEVRKLKLNDGYSYTNIHHEYNDFNDSGIVRPIKERKITSEILAVKNNYILDEYVIIKPNIDFYTFYLNIDGITGYSLLDEESGNAQIILSNNSLDEFFTSIDLIKCDDVIKLLFKYKDSNELKYKVKSEVNIKYNYSNNSNYEYVTYVSSDDNLLTTDFSTAFAKSKYVTNEYQPLTLTNIDFTGDISKNYQLANYSAKGRILPRTINVNLKCLDKIYDGSSVMPFEVTTNSETGFYNGFENVIVGDDIYIDTTFEGNPKDEEHLFAKTGSTILVANDENVGTNKNVTIKSLVLEGNDSANYKLGLAICNQASILKRPINVIINKVRLIRTTLTWEIEYSFANDIKTDNLSISIGTNDDLDIKIYGGIDDSGKSIHTNYTNYPDIINLFFKYQHNEDYKFTEINSEIKLINNNTFYAIEDKIPAKSNVKRMNRSVMADNHYPGGIKLTLDALSNGVQTPYFESEDKKYKLYNGCKIMITNINLNPLNDKIKNYTLLNSTHEAEIEII